MLKSIALSLITCTILFLPAVASAQTSAPADPNSILTQDQAFLGEAGLPIVSVGAIVASVIKMVLGLLGIIFIILIIYAGLLWMTSSGNEDKVEKSKKIMSAALIGLIITMSAYAITIFVIDSLLSSPSEVDLF